MSTQYIKSPLNYTGGKGRLLPQINPLFPQNIERFVDMFVGGANVAINAAADEIIGYDISRNVIDLFTYFQKNTFSEIEKLISKGVSLYGLSDSANNGYQYYNTDSNKGLAAFNRGPYSYLKKDYNNHVINQVPRQIMFYLLIAYGFNNQIRFNKSGTFNSPVGKRDINKSLMNKLKIFIEALHSKSIQFVHADFREIDINSLRKNDFVYADPPYLITTATYNENGGWTVKEEVELLKILDSLNDRGIRFALSNILSNGLVENDMLIDWSKGYKVRALDYRYKNSNYQKKSDKKEKEVLITNY